MAGIDIAKADHLVVAKDLLDRLVSYDTTSSKTNLPLIEFVQAYLERYGITSHLVPNDAGDKANLFATISPPQSLGSQGGIGLSGHTDVVPVKGQNWTTDPFSLHEQDGKLFGRGTTDMKGFLACVLAKVPVFCEAPLTRPVHLIFSYDEEVGCTGVRPLISELGGPLPQPDIVIVGEPTEMTVVDAHKGITAIRTTITGKEAHSSLPYLGINAVSAAGDYLSALDGLGRDEAITGSNARFDPPYSTIHVGKISGGTALNIVPKQCTFLWEVRGLPGADMEKIREELNVIEERVSSKFEDCFGQKVKIETEIVNELPAFAAQPQSEAVSLALRLSEQNETLAVSYGTEAGLFEQGDMPTVICGPGSIRQAHQPDEFITVEELQNCLTFLDRLAQKLAS